MGENEDSMDETRKYWKPIVRQSGLGGEAPNLDFSKVIVGIRRRVWMVLMAGLVMAGGGLYVSQVLSHTYQAEAVLTYLNPRSEGDALNITPPGLSIESVREMVHMPQHLEQIRAQLGLDLELGQMAAMIKTVRVRQSNLLRIVVTSDNPNLSLDLANAAATVVTDSSQERYHRTAAEAYQYYSSEKRNVEEHVNMIHDNIASFKQASGIIELEVASQAAVQAAMSYEKDLKQAQIEEQRLRVEVDSLKAALTDLPDQVVRYEYKQSPLRQRLEARQLDLLTARTRYGPNNPKVRIVQDEIAELEIAVADYEANPPGEPVKDINPLKEQLSVDLLRLEGKLSAAGERKSALSQVIRDVEKEYADVPEEQQELASLMRELAGAEAELEMLRQATRAAESAMETSDADVELFKQAENAWLKRSSATKYLPVAALFVGIMIGLVGVLFMELSDGRLRTPGQLQRSYHIPWLLSIPQIKRLNAHAAAEQLRWFVRTLVDRVEQLPGGKDFRSLAITSSKTGDGKSTIAYQLAEYFSSLGHKTLYIDFDHEANPYLDEDQSLVAPLQNYLKGKSKLEQVLFKGSFHVAKAGRDDAMKELVKTAQMQEFWQIVNSRYDRIIVDTPGIFFDDYAVNIMDLSDASLFVIDSSHNDKQEVDSCFVELETRQKQPVGLVLNQVPQRYLNDPRVWEAVQRATERSS